MSHPALPLDPAALQRHQAHRRTAGRVLAVAAAFSILLAVVLWLNHRQLQAAAPLDSPQLAALKQQLSADPLNETIKQEIRRIDQVLRTDYFQRQARAWWGARLLGAGITVLLLSFYFYRRYAPLLPEPRRGPDRDSAELAAPPQSRRAVAGMGLACIGLITALWLALDPLTAEMFLTAGANGGLVEAPELPDAAQVARQWPRFRGPLGSGSAPAAQLPAPWPVGAGPRILWQLPLERPGNSSPIVWNDRLFLTSADANVRELQGFDASAGKLLWTARADRIAGSPTTPPEVLETTGFAAPTPATDGKQVYALFANGDLLACSFTGQRVWTRALGLPVNQYGHAASLLTWHSTVFVPWDQGDGGRLLALDSATGKTKWEIRRAVQVSWSTPAVITIPGGDQLITSAVPAVIAYRPEDGRELWSATGLKGEFGASPVFDGTQVYALGCDSELLAIKPPVSSTADAPPAQLTPVWTAAEHLPDITSPVSDGRRLWTITSQGDLTCYNATDGRVLYTQALEDDFQASPVQAGDRVLLVGANGKLYLLAASDSFQLLATADLHEPVAASPALTPGRLYIRGSKHLFCIDTQAEAQP